MDTSAHTRLTDSLSLSACVCIDRDTFEPKSHMEKCMHVVVVYTEGDIRARPLIS